LESSFGAPSAPPFVSITSGLLSLKILSDLSLAFLVLRGELHFPPRVEQVPEKASLLLLDLA